MFLALKRIRIAREEGRREGRAEVQRYLDAVNAAVAHAQAAASHVEAALATAAEAQTIAAQAIAQRDTARSEIRLLRERLALRDEENRLARERLALRDEQIRLLRERLAQRENGAGNSSGAA